MRPLAGILAIVLLCVISGCGTNVYSVRLDRSRMLVQNSDFETAMRELTALIRDFPAEPEPCYYLGIVQYSRGNYRECLLNLDRAARRGFSPSFEFNYYTGLSHFYTGDFAGAEKSLSTAVSMRSTGEAWRYLGIARYRLSDYKGAVEAFRNAALGNDAGGYVMYGSALFKQGLNDEALEVFMKAFNLEPGDSDIVFRTAGLLMLNGMDDEAAALYERIPEGSAYYPESLYNRAEASIRLKDYSTAEALLDEYLRIRPGDPEALFNRASCAIQTGDYVYAAGILERLLEHRSNRVRTLYNLGLANFHLRKYPEAVQYLSEAVGLNSGNASFLYALGLALSEDGDKDAAREHMKEVLRNDPGYTNASEWLERNRPHEVDVQNEKK